VTINSVDTPIGIESVCTVRAFVCTVRASVCTVRAFLEILLLLTDKCTIFDVDTSVLHITVLHVAMYNSIIIIIITIIIIVRETVVY
jgi:hypothetical protein